MLMEDGYPKEGLLCEGCNTYTCKLHEDIFEVCHECSDECSGDFSIKWCNSCNNLNSNFKKDSGVYGPYCNKHKGIREYHYFIK